MPAEGRLRSTQDVGASFEAPLRGAAQDEEGASELLTDADFDEVFAADDLVGDGTPLLLAVSGGPDSIALMHAAAAWSRERGRPPLLVATVDHGLRPEARGEAVAVEAEAGKLGLPHAILTWHAPPEAGASQEAAREARYDLLVDHALSAGASRIATAHTFDDQVETILMRLADGSGLSGLAGMASMTPRGPVGHLRPFLHLRKAQLVATCQARGWAFSEDPTNRDPRFARPRWRALSAALAEEGLTPDRIFRLGSRMRRADIALEARAELVLAEVLREEAEGATAELTLDFAALRREPDEIAIRVLIRALRAVVPGGGHLRLERIESAYAALIAARLSESAMRRSLAGCVLSLDRAGLLTIAPERPRNRGR